MKTTTPRLLCSLVMLLFAGIACQKAPLTENLSTPAKTGDPSGFTEYLIPKGAHYTTGNNFKPVETEEMKFTVRFDSSCIYQTTDPENQWDINKLYGFSDNNATHQEFSARFGWRWSEGALRLFAYTYNNSIRNSRELAVVPIGKNISCAIGVTNETYVFSVGEKTETMPRLSKTATAKGYQLYPYFGGDEAAPHEVRVWIREEKE